MVIETQILPLWQWLQTNLVGWLTIVGCLAAVGLVFGWLVGALRNGPIAAFGLTGKVLAAGVVDLTRMSPRRVAALSWLAVKESIRRRVVVVFAVFIVVLLFAGWFLDPTSAHPSRLYLGFVLTATSYLVLLLALFLSSLSLPADIKSKTLHTIVTKPVRASEVVLGRVLGFALMGTFLLLIMASISYVFVVRGLAHQHQVPPEELERAEKVIQRAIDGGASHVALQLRTTKNHGHRHHIAIDLNLAKADGSHPKLEQTGRVRTGIQQDHWHEFSYTFSRDGKQPKLVCDMGGPRDQLVARVPIYGKLKFKDRTGADAPRGVNVGDEWTYRSFIAGGTPAAAVWTFEGITEEAFPKDEFPDGLPVEMTIEVFRTFKGDTSRADEIPAIPGSLSVRSPKKGRPVQVKIFPAKEFTTDVHYIPRKLTTPDGRSIDLFKDVVVDGKMEVWLQCIAPAQYFGAAQPDLYLHARNASFEMNFIKGYLGIWLQMVLVIGIGVMFSTFLSGPIAMLATLGTLVGGLFSQFMFRLSTGEVIGGGPVEATVRLVTQRNLVSQMEPGLRTTITKWADQVLEVGLRVASALLPNFGRFSFADYVAYGFDISSSLLLQTFCHAAALLLPMFVAGYLFLKTREVAK